MLMDGQDLDLYILCCLVPRGRYSTLIYEETEAWVN